MPGVSDGYVPQLSNLMAQSAGALLRSPSHSRRAEARRRLARHSLWLVAALSVLIIVLMFVFDATEIGLMPVRGSPELWPVRVLTDFGKDEYVLWTLAIVFAVAALVIALGRYIWRLRSSEWPLRRNQRVAFVALTIVGIWALFAAGQVGGSISHP